MNSKRKTTHTNAMNSSADIAFLLLIFFLVTAVIKENKGLLLKLPPKTPIEKIQKINARNLYTIKVNSKNQFLINNQIRGSLDGLVEEIKLFILNYGMNKTLSDDPEKAVVSISTSRATTYNTFIQVLDKVQQSYFEIYAERVGMSASAFRNLDLSKPIQRESYDRARAGIPMNISVAEPY